MKPRRAKPRFWLAIYRSLARLYPRSLRGELGAEMEGLFLDLHAEARKKGRSRAAWFAGRACAEVLPLAFRAHGEPNSPTGAHLVHALLSDLRFAWRVVTRQRRHSAVVVATIAIGIGATTAVFSVTDAAILRRLPFPDAHRLVEVAHQHPAGWSLYSQDDAAFRAWGEQKDLFDFIGGSDMTTLVGQIAGQPQEIDAARLSPELLPVLGARPLMGRLLLVEDAAEGSAPVALISDRVWRREFAGAADVVGKTLALDGVDHEVVGVLPREFAFPAARTDVWLALDPTLPGSRMRAMGRLAPGLDLDAAQHRADALAAGLAEVSPRNEGWNLSLIPLDQQRTTQRTRTALIVALAAAALLLLVAVVNVAQIALARAIQRENELSVRAALGAGRPRIVRQVLLENLLLSLGGGLLGVLLAFGFVRVIAAVAPDNLVRIDAIQLGVDWRAFGAALVLAVVAGVAAGLFPAWSASRPTICSALHASKQGLSVSRSRRRVQSSMIVAEATLCLVLLAGAGLLLNSFNRLSSVDPGFDAHALVSLIVQLDTDRYPTPESRVDMLQNLAQRIEALPGVDGATAAGGGAEMPGGTLLAGSLETDTGERIDESTVVAYGLVSDGFFDVVGIEITSGRALTAEDHDSANVVINEPLASRLFGADRVVGRGFRVEDGDWWTVVGVTAPAAAFEVQGKGADLQIYRPLKGNGTPRSYSSVIVRAVENPALLVPQLQDALWDLDPHQPVHRIELGSDTLADWVVEPRFNLLLLGTFAGVALALVLVGVGGVVGHVVASRTREIGIRVALGANRRSILTMATLSGLRPVAAGAVLGGIAVWQTTRFLASLLYGVEPTDLPTLAGVALVFLVATLIASYIPARRALRVSPVRALRSE